MRKITLLLLSAALALVSCGPKKAVEPSAQDFASYIQAFTGGIVTENATLRVDLTEDAAAQPTEGLFVFKPAVKGAVQWNGAQAVCFVPEAGARKAGQTYKITFALGKLIPGAPEQ